MASDMTSAFENVAQEVKNWQDTFGEEIADLLDEIGKKIQEINNIIKESNELGK
jgi:flagellar hook-associated protein FlgK